MTEQSKQKIRLSIEGMTCTGCERHVTHALQGVGAINIAASFQRGEAIFELANLEQLNAAKDAIEASGYQPKQAEVLREERNTHVVNSSEPFDYDLLILGSGSAAFSAAIQAVSFGAKVGMVERGTLGGTCVNIGCVPSKTLLRAGELQRFATHPPFQGLQTTAEPVDLAQLMDGKDELVGNLRQHKYVDLIDEYGFQLIRGEARFVNEWTVEVQGQQITARNFLIATGASPMIPDIPGLKNVDYLVSTTALEVRELPKRLAVIGSGYIALELGQLFHNLGSEVTLMQRSARVLKSYDLEISEALTQALTVQGLQHLTGVTYQRIEQDGDVKRVYLTINGEERVVAAEALLVATGRRPNTEVLNLDAANVKLGDRGEVVVDEFLRTSNPRVYAAGDVTLGPQFVYV
ncbi:mercuric reductase, partial [Alicyclobacillaceae bacterium I2511]